MPIAGLFAMAKCLGCGVYYQYPRLPWEELAPHYVGEYTSYGSLIDENSSWLSRIIKRLGPLKQRRAIEKFCQAGVVLDVGSGAGIFLQEMLRNHQWKVKGLEPTTHIAEYVQSKLGIPIINSTWEEAEIESAALDVLTMWNVFEHLDDPLFSLEKIHRVLKPGGYAVIGLPCYESISRKIFGKYWVGWDLPRHLYIFPSTLLEELFEKHGFKVVEEKFFVASYSIFFDSLTYLLNEHKISAKKYKLIRKIYFSLIMKIILYPIFRLAEFMKLTTVKTWIIRKKD
jgi:SAM-dependent methyltransferase